MKAKYLIGALLMAVLGAAISLFVYTKVLPTPKQAVAGNSSNTELQRAEALMTSLTSQDGQQIDFTYAAEVTVPAVVHVHVMTKVDEGANNPILQWFYGDHSQPQEVQGFGSGVIISPDGYIITNNHVIQDADNIEVTLSDNRTFKAKVVGRDPTTDIALLKINAENLPTIKYGNSDDLKLGQWVLAVGNPFNLTSTVTAGIVSALGRNLNIINNSRRIESFIQTDAALNPGNSGGALVNTKGELIGITSAIVSPNGTYAGNSFAIPVNIVKKVVNDLKEYGVVQRAIIGVNIQEVTQDVADKLKLPEVSGALVTGVNKGGSAEAAGLKANDVIVKFDGVPIMSPNELQAQVGSQRPGDKATITYIRNGKENTVSLILKNIEGNTSIVKPGMVGTTTGLVYGARLESLGSSDKSKYNVDYGVKIAELNDGRFKDLGLKKGYIILSVNGDKVRSAEDVRQATDDESNLSSIEGIQSNGIIFSYSFRN
ncbi:MAG: Do family serine endopeptidase [Bacteroidales bacterium]